MYYASEGTQHWKKEGEGGRVTRKGKEKDGAAAAARGHVDLDAVAVDADAGVVVVAVVVVDFPPYNIPYDLRPTRTHNST